jgi:Fic/DOC family
MVHRCVHLGSSLPSKRAVADSGSELSGGQVDLPPEGENGAKRRGPELPIFYLKTTEKDRRFRRSESFSCPSADNPETAILVPPLPADVPALLAEREQFVNGPARLPRLIQCALMHYQFETIHSFLDGNAGTGGSVAC